RAKDTSSTTVAVLNLQWERFQTPLMSIRS
ncbi:unnamed protein product, partial [Rhizophagus irregularis]